MTKMLQVTIKHSNWFLYILEKQNWHYAYSNNVTTLKEFFSELTNPHLVYFITHLLLLATYDFILQKKNIWHNFITHAIY